MFPSHRLQTNRYEYKYVVSPEIARAISRFVAPLLVPDEFADPAQDNSYLIHSLYLDNPAQDLCRATLNGDRNRYKLRIRFYNHDPQQPVFCEIKRRIHDAIAKERVAIHRSAIPRLISTFVPDRMALVKNDTSNWSSLLRFCELAATLPATQGLFVSYRREAYVSPVDNNVRVTLDRDVTAGHYDPDLQVRPLSQQFQPHIPGVILELKFTDRFPVWMRELVWQYNLRRQQMAKYVSCAVSLDQLTYRVLGEN